MTWYDTRLNSPNYIAAQIVANGNASHLTAMKEMSLSEVLTCWVEKALPDGTPVSPKVY